MIIGFALFLLTGIVFGYSAPKGWAFAPVALPILVGLYTGFMDKFDTELIILILVGIGVTVVGIIVGRAIEAATERGGSTA